MQGKGFGLLFEMGCGKTLTSIAIAGAGYKMDKVHRVLIVAPTSVVAVWPKELQEYAAFPYVVKTLLGDKRQRLKALDDLQRFPYPHLKIAVINYESVWRDEIEDALNKYNADLIICDESQRIKSHDAQQSKALHRLGDQARYKMILSGTPIQNDATDIWSQYRFLDKTVFGTNFYTFRNKYCEMGGFSGKQVVGIRPESKAELIEREHSVAFRVTKAEALDLPEQTFETRTVSFSRKERDIYDQIRKDSCAELEGGGTITATTVLTKLLRLQQFTGGFLAEDDADRPTLVCRAKLEALRDILEDYVRDGKKKLVIFARFIPEVMEIIKLSEKLLAPDKKKTVAIYGAIKKEERGEIIKQFQTDPDTMVIVGQIDTLGVGVTLTAADTCVYYSVNFNFATYDQSKSRIHRIGQHHPCTYIHLTVENTLDSMVLKALEKKQDLAKTVVDDWRQFF